MRVKIKYRIIIALIIIPCFLSCKKFIQVDLAESQIDRDVVFSSDRTATAAITGIYSTMVNQATFASGRTNSVTALSALSADELRYHLTTSVDFIMFVENELLASGNSINTLWKTMYSSIYSANAALEGIAGSTGMSPAVKTQLKGEALFTRAFCYFYLVNLFGEVPLITTIDYQQNAIASKNSIDEIYTSIINDLTTAQGLLGDSYVTTGRVRPNKAAATALLARVYLYKKDWVNAELQSTAVITNSNYSLLTNANINNVFKSDSREAIWQLQPAGTSFNTGEGNLFILTTAPNASRPFSLTNTQLNAFEAGDDRRAKWVSSIVAGGNTYYFPHKYKIGTGGTSSNPAVPLTEYSMVLRLAEQYLIRAEARAWQDKFTEAQSDINAIRNRALLGNTTANDRTTLLTAIEQERRVELFTEWGHRWLDLKRTNRADAILPTLKSPHWQFTDVLYPIPQPEIDLNPNMTQNPGY
ncbi:MAG TPA: RagB/SusD family nutrient uptake outer membrane protein [Chitinophagaceae bacterium]|jgi:hypothetical protein|nr:RagB/SusD family nutrient uptake outer membrane protein [Chitinophagaceae bacterium]